MTRNISEANQDQRRYGAEVPAGQARVTEIHSFLSGEQEPGFLFPGGAFDRSELIFVEKGSLCSVAEGKALLLQPGELAVYPAGQWHMQYADIGVAPQCVSISFSHSGDLALLRNRKFTLSQSEQMLLRNMLQEQKNVDPYSPGILLAQLDLMLLLLLRKAAQRKDADQCKPNGEHEIVCRTQRYICTHVREKLSVPVVAKQVNVSPSYLTALFHKNLQISPGEYIRRIKLQESKRMIREDQLNFTQIAEMLQYSTVHHFSRQFKEKFGVTPTEYAKSVK